MRMLWVAVGAALLIGCATPTHRGVAIEPDKATVGTSTRRGSSRSFFVGQFANRSTYMQGMFTDGIDRLGHQARAILTATLRRSGRFRVVDRDSHEAHFEVAGDITEFGLKVVTDAKPIAYAKVTLDVVDLKTSRFVYSAQGVGEHVLSSRDVGSFGSVARYDASLNGKLLDLAIRDAVDRLAEASIAGSSISHRIDSGLLRAAEGPEHASESRAACNEQGCPHERERRSTGQPSAEAEHRGIDEQNTEHPAEHCVRQRIG